MAYIDSNAQSLAWEAEQFVLGRGSIQTTKETVPVIGCCSTGFAAWVHHHAVTLAAVQCNSEWLAERQVA